MRYEGYAPGGVAVIVEALTDNRNRTAGEVRSYFTKAGGSLAETGAVSFMFDRVGLIVFDRKVASEDAMLEAAIEAGADDVATSGQDEHEIITSLEALREVAEGARGESSASRARRLSSGGRRTRSLSTTKRARRSCASSARSKTTTTCRTSTPISKCPTRWSPRWVRS